MSRIAYPMIAALALATSACSSMGGGDSGISPYQLVKAQPKSVGNGSMVVTPPRPWNKQRPIWFVDISEVEDWTLNGPYLDGISFVSGLKDNRTLIRQQRRDTRQVPYFRSNMTAPEVASMIESLFRIRGGTIDFRSNGLQARPFLGTNGFQYDFEHLDSDELWRKGRAVGAVVNGRLYLILFDAARSHYYANALSDFEAMANSARLKG